MDTSEIRKQSAFSICMTITIRRIRKYLEIDKAIILFEGFFG